MISFRLGGQRPDPEEGIALRHTLVHPAVFAGAVFAGSVFASAAA